MQEEAERIFQVLMDTLPTEWDGKECIEQMRSHDCRHWKQMEWPGFYFQFQCESILSKNNFMTIPGPRYGNVEFDGLRRIPWDFKAHVMKQTGRTDPVPTNGYDEVEHAIHDYGKVGFIVACGDAIKDDANQSFKFWHDSMKGGMSEYERLRILRDAPSRRRKVSFILNRIEFVILDSTTLRYCGEFQKDMRNSDGSPRKRKVMLNLSDNRLEKYSFTIY